MDDERSEPAKEKPSQVPSWVTLGFMLGALFVLALPRRGARRAGTAPMESEPASKPPAPRAAPTITTIEAVFAAWEKYAVWSNGTTEVALWSPETKSFSEFYEVARVGETPISGPSRALRGRPHPWRADGIARLQFTETARQRAGVAGRGRQGEMEGASASGRAAPARPRPQRGDGK